MRLRLVPLRLVLASLLVGGLIWGGPARAQSSDLNCGVQVSFSEVGGTEFSFLEDLRTAISDYVNNRSWTELFFEEIERIDCNIVVTVRSAETLSRFNAQLVITSRRPIYGTRSSTNVFAISDPNWTFDYNRGDPLIYDPNRYNSLTSLIDFYVFLVLGYDFDTFEELGGTPYFEQAREIADIAASRGDQDWLAIGEDRSRATLVRQLLDPLYTPLRRAYYQYHLGGLDRFAARHEEAWTAAYEAIEGVYGVFEEFNQLRYALDIFLTVKSDEIVALFRDAEQNADLFDLLVEMNPSNLQVYESLVN